MSATGLRKDRKREKPRATSEIKRRYDYGDTEDEGKDFTQALLGAMQMLNALVRKLNLDKEKNEGIRELGNVITYVCA